MNLSSNFFVNFLHQNYLQKIFNKVYRQTLMFSQNNERFSDSEISKISASFNIPLKKGEIKKLLKNFGEKGKIDFNHFHKMVVRGSKSTET